MILVSAITSIVIATLIIVLPSTYSEGMQSYIDNTFIQLSALAQAGGYQIDAAALEKINLPRDYMSDEYIRLWNSLRGLINEEYEWNKSIYCVLYRYVDGVLWTPIFMDGTGGAYYPYDYFPESLEQVFLKGETERVDADIAADGEWMYIHSPVYNREQKIVGALEVGLNLTAFQSNYKRIYLSIVFAVIAASVVLQIIVMQIIKAIDYLDERKRSLLSLKEKDAAGGNSKSITLNYEPVEFVNPTVFLLYFAFNMVTAFLPMYSAALYEPLSRNSLFSAFPREFMEAFPISAHLAAVGIGCAAAGTIVRKIGFRTTTGIGGFLMLVSCILLGFTSKYIIFTIFFFFMGLGFGLMTNAISGSIAAIPNEAKRSLGFTYYNSSLFSGFCCGTVIGAALAESLGGREVFLVSAAATLFPVIVLCILLKDPVNKRLIEEHTTVSLGQTMRRSILSFLLKPDVFLFFLFSLIPYTLAGYFMFYFMPRFAEENLGLSPSVIGQLFLVHGIAVLVFSTALTKWTAKYFTSNAICLSFVLIAAAFLIFGLNPSLHTLIIALFLLGVGSSFGAASLSNYYVNLNSVHTYGYEKSMSVYQTVENSGDTLAPIIFGYALSGSLQQNFILFTLILIVLLLVLAIALKRRPEYSDILSK
jgi:predicted MFS family arabinose efflux permease